MKQIYTGRKPVYICRRGTTLQAKSLDGEYITDIVCRPIGNYMTYTRQRIELHDSTEPGPMLGLFVCGFASVWNVYSHLFRGITQEHTHTGLNVTVIRRRYRVIYIDISKHVGLNSMRTYRCY